MTAYRVLLADDHARLRDLYKLALADEPRLQVVAEASTGAEAARLARDTKPDLVVLDLSMPDQDGLQALQAIKRDTPDARVVVLSGFLRDRVEPLVMQMGANAYLEKGVPLGDIPGLLLRHAQEQARTPTLRLRDDELLRRAAELI